MINKINSIASRLHPKHQHHDVFWMEGTYFWLVLGGGAANVGLCSPQRTPKTKMHQVSGHAFRSNLNCSVINTAKLALLCFTAEVGSEEIPHLQCCVI